MAMSAQNHGPSESGQDHSYEELNRMNIGAGDTDRVDVVMVHFVNWFVQKSRVK